ncbi:hypothetical protein EBZ38_07550 [bacterium]|jgi:hypothetical protein|nr:hypothetical protein [bacterium]
MNNVVDLKNYKDRERLKIISGDLEVIIRILSLTLKGLENFQKYSNVTEVASYIKTNLAFYEISLNKCKRLLNGELEKKEEKDTE